MVHVVTAPGDSFTDTVVEAFSGAGSGSIASLGGPSSDSNFHEDHVRSFWVRVSYSTFGFVDDAYTLTVTLE